MLGPISELSRYRGLLGMLAWRDIRVRYKQSLLGFSWAFIMPLINTLVLFTIFTYGPVHIDENDTQGVPYLLFVMSGVVGWSFFAGAIASGMDCLTRNSRLVTKIYFPREVFPIASVAGSAVDFLIAALVIVPFYIYFVATGKAQVSPMLLLMPAIFLIQAIFVTGMSLVLSMANLFFRDVKYVMTFILQMWFFATNVVYPIRFENYPKLQWLVSANPMIPILDAYRDCLMGRPIGNPLGLLLAAAIATALLLIGWRVFHRAAFKFAEYV